MTKKIATAFKLSQEEVDQLKIMAKEKGISYSDLLRQGARLFGSFDKFFLDRVLEYSTKFKTIPSHIIQSMMIKQFAYEDAEREVNGPMRRDRIEFICTDDGPMSGEELYDYLKSRYVSQLERDKKS